jgi:hypothetical protein
MQPRNHESRNGMPRKHETTKRTLGFLISCFRVFVALCFVVSWLFVAAAPVFAQAVQPAAEEAPLTVETVGLDPTVGKTGDVITATYRVRFPDLISKGKEVLVLEDRMAPENLPLAPFDAVGLDVDKRQVGDLHVWDFVYRLRLVGPQKAPTTLRSVTFYWLVRDIGQKIEDAQVRQSTTDPLTFRYVTTITDDAVLHLRDDIELGAFARRAALFRLVGWGIAPLPLVIWVVAAVMALRRPRPSPAMKPGVQKEEEPEAPIPESPTLQQARRQMRRQLQALGNGAHGGAGSELDIDLVSSLRSYLKAEMPDLNPGDTAKNIVRHIEMKVPEGRRKEALAGLAARLVAYQNGLERGTPVASADPAGEAQELEALMARLPAHGRLLDRVKRAFGQ